MVSFPIIFQTKNLGCYTYRPINQRKERHTTYHPLQLILRSFELKRLIEASPLGFFSLNFVSHVFTSKLEYLQPCLKISIFVWYEYFYDYT